MKLYYGVAYAFTFFLLVFSMLSLLFLLQQQSGSWALPKTVPIKSSNSSTTTASEKQSLVPKTNDKQQVSSSSNDNSGFAPGIIFPAVPQAEPKTSSVVASSSSSSSSSSLQTPRTTTTTTTPTNNDTQQQNNMLGQKPLVNVKRVVMLNFDDAWVDQFLLAKPILDKYNFKASFFLPCGHVGSNNTKYMNWNQISQLVTDGMDMESHTMTHKHLVDRNGDPQPDDILQNEISGPLDCFANHDIARPQWFGYPLGLGSNNSKIVHLVAENYRFARTGDEKLFLLDCNGYRNQQGARQPDNCAPFDSNGDLTWANRFSVRAKSFFHIVGTSSNGGGQINYNEDQMFNRFVARVNAQDKFNVNNQVRAIPIMTYHDITNSPRQYNQEGSTITAKELERELKYLHDNHFAVKLLTDLRFNINTNTFFLR